MLREHFLTTSDSDKWRERLPISRSVFGSVEYARISEQFRQSSPRLYVMCSDNSNICYPMLLRSTSELPFNYTGVGNWDSATPDFTGPLLSGINQEVMAAFPDRCRQLFRSIGVITEFAHLHPWSNAYSQLDQSSCTYNREIVWVDLTLGPQQLWRNHLQHCCRKNISTAGREGVRVFASRTDKDLDEFCRIYTDTMQRNGALAAYYFPSNFFRALRNEMPENCRFVFAEYQSQIVAATLYLHDDSDVFSFLGGTDTNFQHVRPTNALIWETIQWASAAGKKRLVLGGGYKPDDGVFHFKSTFSRLRQAFYIYKRVHLQEYYEQLERQYCDFYDVTTDALSYFPTYRQIYSRENRQVVNVSDRNEITQDIR